MYPPVQDGKKIERKYLGHLINVTPGSATETYVRLGKDLESYNQEFSPQVDKKKNILGETSITLSSYEVSSSVETYYAEKGTPLHLYLQDIVDNRKVLDDVVTDALEVHFFDPTTATPPQTQFEAYKEEVHIAVTSAGGDSTGYQIPFDIHYTGKRTKGVYDTDTKTFTASA